MSTWPMARKVQIEAAWVRCELDNGRAYSFMDAYRRTPHISFMNLRSEDELAAFVQTWGPLRIPDTSPKGTSWMQIQWYWDFQRDLTATARLLRSFCKHDGEKEALEEFIAVKKQQNPTPETTSTTELFLAVSLPNDPVLQELLRNPSKTILSDWNAQTSTAFRRQAIAGLIQLEFTNAKMFPNQQTGQIELNWELNNLEEALTWMVFQDAITQRPSQVCPECQTVFRPATCHEKKFCAYECAHRAAARNWRRRDLHYRRSTHRRPRPKSRGSIA